MNNPSPAAMMASPGPGRQAVRRHRLAHPGDHRADRAEQGRVMVEGGEEDGGGAVAALVHRPRGSARRPRPAWRGRRGRARGLGGNAGREIHRHPFGHAAEQAGDAALPWSRNGRAARPSRRRPASPRHRRVRPLTPRARTIASAASRMRVRASFGTGPLGHAAITIPAGRYVNRPAGIARSVCDTKADAFVWPQRQFAASIEAT